MRRVADIWIKALCLLCVLVGMAYFVEALWEYHQGGQSQRDVCDLVDCVPRSPGFGPALIVVGLLLFVGYRFATRPKPKRVAAVVATFLAANLSGPAASMLRGGLAALIASRMPGEHTVVDSLGSRVIPVAWLFVLVFFTSLALFLVLWFKEGALRPETPPPSPANGPE